MKASKALQSSHLCICLLLQSSWSPAALMTAATHDLVTARQDVIGSYRLSNRMQCRKMCWYRFLCTSFSYLGDTDPELNCVLHSSHVEDADTVTAKPSGWSEQPASAPASGTDTGCGARPCGSTQLCVPGPGGSFHCMPLASSCGDPNPVPNARLSFTATRQGDVAVVQCHAGFVQSPREVSMETKCQVNSRWTTFEGECIQAEFHNVPKFLSTRLPWSLLNGSEVCVQGVFISQHRMTFNMKKDPWIGGDLMAHIDFRRQWGRHKRLILVTSTFNHLYGRSTLLTRPPMMLEPGDSFSLTFRVTADALLLLLQIMHRQNLRYSVPLGPVSGIDLTPARYVVMGPGVTLNYVNLVSGCPG